jgi:3-oxoacyl-[acyl-carrier protein] reductase
MAAILLESSFMAESPALTLADCGVLVTGASSGIGRAIALAMARAGANVAITYRSNRDGADAVAREIESQSRRATVQQLDLADEPAIERIAPAVRTALGRLDVWINNAGADILTGPGASLSTVQKLDLLLAVDLRGTILASWAAARFFEQQEGGGTIINMSWDHVASGMPGTNPQMFAAVKGGVAAFSRGLARSVAPRVRVNVIAPGWIETSFGERLDSQAYRSVAHSTPLRRWGTPDDVAGAAVFLASPAAGFITGQTINIGGGVVMSP